MAPYHLKKIYTQFNDKEAAYNFFVYENAPKSYEIFTNILLGAIGHSNNKSILDPSRPCVTHHLSFSKTPYFSR